MGVVHRTRISNSVRKDLYTRLHKFSVDSRIPISKILDEAIEDVLRKHSVDK